MGIYVKWGDNIARISVDSNIGGAVIDVSGAPVSDFFAHKSSTTYAIEGFVIALPPSVV